MNAEMSYDDTQKLHKLQSQFERDPLNVQAAYDLFSELNRHGRYNTVIRLYDKHELAYASAKDPYADRMRSQYEFARDNIGSLGISLNAAADGDSQRITSQNLNKVLFSKSHYSFLISVFLNSGRT